jgi:Carboxypeptidase regulatory-like domain
MSENFNTLAAFAHGLLLHEGTGRPPNGSVQMSADEGPVVGRVLDDGRFVVSGYGVSAQQVHLHIHANSAQYRAGFTDVLVVVQIPPGADFDPEPPAVPTPLVDLGAVLLPADPVNLRGRVVDASNPGAAVAGASVELMHGGPNAISPVMTDAGGHYRFDEIVVKAPITIQFSKLDFQTETRSLLLDFGKLINEENARLQPLP